MKCFSVLVLALALGLASAAVPASRSNQINDGTGEVDLSLISTLRKVLAWMDANDISIEDIFTSEFFNSGFFNSDIFNSDYFNSDFFNSELFNSEIFNEVNFLKVTTALFGLDGVTNDGKWQPAVAADIVHLFEVKDWEGLKQYLNSLPPPAASLLE